MLIALVRDLKNLLANLRRINFLVIAIFWMIGIKSTRNSKFAEFADSGGYVVGTTSNAWGNISFDGHSVRAWPTLLVNSLGNSSESRVWIQTILYLLAVSLFLLSTIAFRRTLASNIATILICCLFLSNNVFQWNLAILAESTTLSFVLIGLSFFFLALKHEKFEYLFLLIGIFTMMLASLVRMQLLVPVAILVLVTLLIKRKRLFSILGVITITLATSYVSLVNSNINAVWGGGAALTSKNTVSFYFLTAYQTKNDQLTDRLFKALPESAPRCLKTNDSRAPFVDAPGPYVFQSQQYGRCLSGVLWLNDNFIKFYLKFLIFNPVHIFETARTYLPESISDVKYGTFHGSIPSWLETFWMTNPNGIKDSLPFYTWVFLPLISLLYAIQRLRKESSESNHKVDKKVSQSKRKAAVELLKLKRKEGLESLVIYASAWVGFFVSLTATYLFMNAELSRIAVSSVYPFIALSIIILMYREEPKRRLVKDDGKRKQ